LCWERGQPAARVESGDLANGALHQHVRGRLPIENSNGSAPPPFDKKFYGRASAGAACATGSCSASIGTWL